MENYWLKSGDKTIVTKRLDADLDSYFAKSKTADTEPVVAAAPVI